MMQDILFITSLTHLHFLPEKGKFNPKLLPSLNANDERKSWTPSFVFLKGLLIQGKQVTCGLLESFYTPCCTVSFHSMTAYLTSCSERSKLQSLYFQSEYIFVENSLIHSLTTSQKKTVFGNILLNMNKLKSLRMLWGSWHCQNMNSLSATSISWVSKNIWVQMKKITAAWKLGRKVLRGLRKRSPLPLSFPSSIPFCHFSFFNFVLKTWQNKQEGSNSW